jgi:signal transduction histidine kinase
VIDDILDISKIEAGRLEIESELVAPRELALEVSSLLHVRADEKKLKFAIEFQSAIPQTIETDRKRLRQVLLNLVGNAIKFTDAGEVRLSVRMLAQPGSDERRIVFEISDTGVGIGPSQMQSLFSCFTQADMSSTRRHRGIGLGLALSMRLARMLDGEITVTSEPGTGSTFRLLLPANPPRPVPLVSDEIADERAPFAEPALAE